MHICVIATNLLGFSFLFFALERKKGKLKGVKEKEKERKEKGRREGMGMRKGGLILYSFYLSYEFSFCIPSFNSI